MNHFFVDESQIEKNQISGFIGGRIKISGSDLNHIKNVLRMKTGEGILISDGDGNDFECRISGFSDKEVLCDIISQSEENRELKTDIVLYQALIKADKFETVIQKCVELGVSRIVPVETRRVIVKFDDKKEKARLERWRSISESAAKQSKRSVIPEISPVMTFKEAISDSKKNEINSIAYEEYKDSGTLLKLLRSSGKVSSIGIFIGPEGGFEPEEVQLANENGISNLTLGKRILRTETAGMAVIAALMLCETGDIRTC